MLLNFFVSAERYGERNNEEEQISDERRIVGEKWYKGTFCVIKLTQNVNGYIENAC